MKKKKNIYKRKRDVILTQNTRHKNKRKKKCYYTYITRQI